MWYYNNEPFEPDEEFIDQYVGFVYVITETQTGMKYLGKKLFHRSKILPVTKTRKRRKKVKVQSDWPKYYGSSETVKTLLEQHGEAAFHREILRLCKSKGECSYYEAKLQFDHDVLLKDEYYNGIINCRINRKHVQHLRE